MEPRASSPPSPTPTMAALTANGESDSWEEQKTNHLRIFELFRNSDPALLLLMPTAWDALPASLLCSQDVYNKFGHYLVHVYKIGARCDHGGNPLAIKVVLKVLSGMLNRARDKFFANGDALTREFFTCMDTKSSTLNAKWLGGLKKKIERICFERAMNGGNLTDY